MIFNSKNTTKVTSAKGEEPLSAAVAFSMMDDVQAFAKVMVDGGVKGLSYLPAVRSNIVCNRQDSSSLGESPSIYLLAMEDQLASVAGSFYKPSIPVRCRSDCDIWNFVSSTNKARK